MSQPEQPTSNRGVLAALGAYGIWGFVALYWPLLNHSGALEVLAHRVVWSLLLSVLLVAIIARRRWRSQVADRGALVRLALAAVVIAANWGIYIWAVSNGHITEVALGYYINPLLSIMIGVLLMSERLAPVQWVAIGLAVVAVVVLTIGYGGFPWIALSLATTFALYGVIKKQVKVEPVVSSAWSPRCCWCPLWRT